MTLRPGDQAPPFRAQDTEGKERSLGDYRGRKLVLYFYPKDDTPGCTKEACSLRDHNAEIRAKGADVLGVSTDGVGAHQKFAKKFQLNFPLLADSDKAIGRAYGTIGGIMGLLGLNKRVTYVIDEQGRIAHVIDDVDCANHAEQVLKLI